MFSCSSAQQLAWIKESYPELFGRIREKVQAGQFVPVGGMWVESDTNMPGGEAMARQFIEGKSFFLAEFGVDCQEAWLPDSFGYSAALPQIVKAAGSRCFLTQKISWNQVNRMPHHTFNWEGIDGTRLFTHFPPVDTYNSDLSGRDLAHAERNYRDHGRGTVSLVPFGYGDGGGGPTREMLAAAHRTADLEGSPEGADRIRRQTSSAGAEAEYTVAARVGGRNVPGTAPRNVHQPGQDQTRATGAANTCSGKPSCGAPPQPSAPPAHPPTRRLNSNASGAWSCSSSSTTSCRAVPSPGSTRTPNATTPPSRAGLEAIIAGAAAALLGEGEQEFLLNAAPHPRIGVPALAVAPPVRQRAGRSTMTAADGGYILDNGVIRAVLDADGLLSSLPDYASGREAIAPGQCGNLLELHRDTPNEWDAWDIDDFYRRNVVRLTEAPHGDAGVRRPGRRRRGGGAAGRIVAGHPADLAGGGQRTHWPSRRRSTGRNARSCSNSASRWTSGRTVPPPRRSSAMSSAPPT